ncbi:melibiose:sodium transporter MelB [Succinivibrio dextrinosolvens]|uniref:melibiose:sodium transporter MelB n=1 Tax=Succinivibrio dextrinosolvens TaxID=83771 RepID=UPI001922094B|nr:melibiose:sodium transporter MelB [Succinivibrio dextrinosolvens]
MSNDISLREKISFGIGAVGKDMGYWIMAAYLMVYFTDVVKLNPAYVGFLFLFARIFDAINDPIMGWIVDNTRTRFGKFRPWIFIGTLVNCAIVTLLFFDPTPYFGPMGVMIWCGLFYILWGVSYTIMDIPYWSMIPAFSSDSKVRDVMSVIPRTGAMIGGQFVVIFGLPIIAFLGKGLGGTEAQGFFRYTLLIVLCFIIFETICVANVREHVKTPLRNKIAFKDMLGLLAKNDQLVVIIVLTIIQQIACNLVFGTMVYYFKYAFCREDLYPYFMAAGAVSQFIAFVIFPSLTEKTSRKTVYLLSASLMVVGYLSMFFFGSTAGSNPFVAGGAYCIASLGNALALVCTTVMLADTVDYGEYKLGTRSESIVFSMQTMTVKFGGALANFMSSITLAVVGYIPNEVQSEGTILGLRTIMFVASSVLFIIMMVIYLKKYKLNGAFYKNMLSALEVSRSEALDKKAQNLKVRYAIDEDAVSIKVHAANKTEAINMLVDSLKDNPNIEDLEAFRKAVFARESESSTGIADGIALPHAKSSVVKKSVIAVATLDTPIDFESQDGKAVDTLFLIASPEDADAHLSVIGKLGLILNDATNVRSIKEVTNTLDLVDLIGKAEKNAIAAG